jgi:hypothetical protein
MGKNGLGSGAARGLQTGVVDCPWRRCRCVALSALALTAALAIPPSALAAQPRDRMPRALWEAFPLEPPPAAERLEPSSPAPVKPVARLETRTAAAATGDSDPIPLTVLVVLAGAAAAALFAGGVTRVDWTRRHLARARGRLQVAAPHSYALRGEAFAFFIGGLSLAVLLGVLISLYV